MSPSVMAAVIAARGAHLLQRVAPSSASAARLSTSAALRSGEKDKKFTPDTKFEIKENGTPLDLLEWGSFLRLLNILRTSNGLLLGAARRSLHPSKIKTANTLEEKELQRKQEKATQMWWQHIQEIEKEYDEAKKKAAEDKKKVISFCWPCLRRPLNPLTGRFFHSNSDC